MIGGFEQRRYRQIVSSIIDVNYSTIHEHGLTIGYVARHLSSFDAIVPDRRDVTV